MVESSLSLDNDRRKQCRDISAVEVFRVSDGVTEPGQVMKMRNKSFTFLCQTLSSQVSKPELQNRQRDAASFSFSGSWGPRLDHNEKRGELSTLNPTVLRRDFPPGPLFPKVFKKKEIFKDFHVL